MNAESISPRLLAGGLSIFAVLLFFSFGLDVYKIDDAYIHFRIAENFAEYGQPYFNRQESVMATSSPVWTYLLSLIALGGLPLSETVGVLNAAFTAVGACTWTILLVDLRDETNMWVQGGMTLGYVGTMIPSALGLMETPLAMMMLALGGISVWRGSAVGWVLLALATFTRLELIVFTPLFLVVAVLGRSRKLSRIEIGTVIFSFVALAYATWATWGALRPNTMAAKQVVYDIAPTQTLKNVAFTVIPDSTLPAFSAIVALALTAFALYGLVRMLQQTGLYLWEYDTGLLWAIAIATGGVGIASAYIIKAVHLHEWYQPLYIFPSVFFIFCVTRYSTSFWGAAGCLLLIPAQTIALFSLSVFSPTYLPDKTTSARVQRYLEVGEVLERTFPNARLMTSEIGGLGYAFDGKILDGVGLITPDALKHHPVKIGDGRTSGGVGAIPCGYVAEETPELIVSYPTFAEDVMGKPVAESYEVVDLPAFSAKARRTLNVDSLWGSDQLHVLVHEQIATPRRLNHIREKLEGLPSSTTLSR